MSTHFEDAEGLSKSIDLDTENYVFNQTMLRIKDPKISLDFYTRIMGMTLYRKLDFPEMKFTLYFLAMKGKISQINLPRDLGELRTLHNDVAKMHKFIRLHDEDLASIT